MLPAQWHLQRQAKREDGTPFGDYLFNGRPGPAKDSECRQISSAIADSPDSITIQPRGHVT